MRLIFLIRRLHMLWIVLLLLAALVFFLEVVADVGGSGSAQPGIPLDSGATIPTVPAAPQR